MNFSSKIILRDKLWKRGKKMKIVRFCTKISNAVFKESLMLITMFFMVPPPVSSGRAKRLR